MTAIAERRTRRTVFGAVAAVLLVVAAGLIAWVLGTQLPTYLGTSRPSGTPRALAAGTEVTPTSRPTSALVGRQVGEVLQHAVDAHAHPQPLLHRLEVQVAGAQVDGAHQQEVEDAHRPLAGGLAGARRVRPQ